MTAQQQPSLLTLLEPIDRTTQVDRIPGVDAPCACGRKPCLYPFCKPPEQPERSTE